MQGSIDNSTGATRVQSLFTTTKFFFFYVQSLTFYEQNGLLEKQNNVGTYFALHFYVFEILLIRFFKCMMHVKNPY